MRFACYLLILFICKIARPGLGPTRKGLSLQACLIIGLGTKSLFSSRHGRHRQSHRRGVFDHHEVDEKPCERYVLMRTKSALSGVRHANVSGFGVRTGRKFANKQAGSMIGIVLVTHGRLAAEFRAALEHVVGPQKQIESIASGPDDDIEQRRQDIVSAVTKVDSGAGVAVLTDMFGGTPSNLAISVMNGPNTEVIAAVNLPMLIKLAEERETSSLDEAVNQAQDADRRYICAASRVLGANINPSISKFLFCIDGVGRE
jgi:mannose PTS system EIIA component